MDGNRTIARVHRGSYSVSTSRNHTKILTGRGGISQDFYFMFCDLFRPYPFILCLYFKLFYNDLFITRIIQNYFKNSINEIPQRCICERCYHKSSCLKILVNKPSKDCGREGLAGGRDRTGQVASVRREKSWLLLMKSLSFEK